MKEYMHTRFSFDVKESAFIALSSSNLLLPVSFLLKKDGN